MLYNAKNGILRIGGTEMEYIRFGNGKKNLIMLPGLGDGLRTMKGTALPMALMYRLFAMEFTVYAFSRRALLPEGFSTRDMARDQAQAMDWLGLQKAHIMGVSMGGMIAQWLAVDFPEKVDRLVLAVTSARPNPILEESVGEWIALAESGDHNALMDSNLRRIYSNAYYRKNRWAVPFLGRFTRPGSYDRFLKQANACLTHDAFAELHRVQAPTLVIGGGKDQTLGGDASREIAGQISGARLRMYPDWGHGLYEEAKDFNESVYSFLTL